MRSECIEREKKKVELDDIDVLESVCFFHLEEESERTLTDEKL